MHIVTKLSFDELAAFNEAADMLVCYPEGGDYANEVVVAYEATEDAMDEREARYENLDAYRRTAQIMRDSWHQDPEHPHIKALEAVIARLECGE